MNELHFLIHNLSDLAPNHDRRPHCRVVDIWWKTGRADNTSPTITGNTSCGSDADRKRPLSKTETTRAAVPHGGQKGKVYLFWLPRTDFYLLPQFCDHGIVRFVIAIT